MKIENQPITVKEFTYELKCWQAMVPICQLFLKQSLHNFDTS